MQNELKIKPSVTIYTDGSCSPNPGNGGWGTVLMDDKGNRKEIYGGEKDSTNNRMELLAVIKALEALKQPCKVSLHTDSRYVEQAFNANWLDKWQKNGWRSANKKAVKNKDLWQTLLKLTQEHEINWAWVKGHNGNTENERCDELANQGRTELTD